MSKNDYTRYSNKREKEFIKEEPILDIEAKPEPKIGSVVDCKMLNVRKEPSIESEVLCEISWSTELMIYEEESTDEFYKICTASGVEGYCMKKFISINS